MRQGVGSFGPPTTDIGAVLEDLFDSFTAGSVIFADGTTLAEDNSNFFWDDTNNRLGLGTNTTTATLTMGGEIAMGDNPITNIGYMDFNLVNGIAQSEGRLVWNATDGTLNLGLAGGVVNLQIGQEEVVRGKNTSGSTITNGQAVRISGGSGNKPTWGLADADNPAAAGSIGLATEEMDNNANGYVTTTGLVRDVDTSSFSVGDRLYLSNTPGELTTTAPTSTERIVFIGIVLASSADEGIIYVSPINTSYLRELSGNTFTTETQYDHIEFNGTIWQNVANLNMADSALIYFGDNQDSSISFDGDSLNIVANAVTAGDTLQLTGASYTFNAGAADTDIPVNFSATTNSGLFTWMEDEDQFDFADEVALKADNLKLYFGAGDDMGIYYDGTNGNIDTDLVAASDLTVDCGTDKTIVLEETVWDDLRTPVSALRLPAANPPTVTSYKSGQVLAFSSASDNFVYFLMQLPHKYKEGTDILMHIHWTLPTAGSGGGAENVKWDLTYSWANITAAFPVASSGTVTVDVQNDVVDDHMIDTVATLTGTSKNLSSMLICSLKRDTSVANDYADDAYLLEIDAHFEIDTIGSRQVGTK